MAIRSGMPIPIAAKTMWNASDSAIWERAKKKSVTAAHETSRLLAASLLPLPKRFHRLRASASDGQPSLGRCPSLSRTALRQVSW